jgi:hypothetical protein
VGVGRIILTADCDGCHFEIQEVGGEGFYVWRFVGENTRSSHDYLQDSLLMAKRCALDEWGVPDDAWKPIAPGQVARVQLGD